LESVYAQANQYDQLFGHASIGAGNKIYGLEAWLLAISRASFWRLHWIWNVTKALFLSAELFLLKFDNFHFNCLNLHGGFHKEFVKQIA
jgi:hypothetical protein